MSFYDRNFVEKLSSNKYFGYPLVKKNPIGNKTGEKPGLRLICYVDHCDVSFNLFEDNPENLVPISKKKTEKKEHSSECKLVEVEQLMSLGKLTKSTISKNIANGNLKLFSLKEIDGMQEEQPLPAESELIKSRTPTISERDARSDIFQIVSENKYDENIIVTDVKSGSFLLMDTNICEEIISNKSPFFFINKNISGFTLLVLCERLEKFKIQACAVFHSYVVSSVTNILLNLKATVERMMKKTWSVEECWIEPDTILLSVNIVKKIFFFKQKVLLNK